MSYRGATERTEKTTIIVKATLCTVSQHATFYMIQKQHNHNFDGEKKLKK